MDCEECEAGCLVLGVEVDATSKEIKVAYRDLVKVWHPDRFGSDERLRRKADDQLKRINQAHSHLSSHRSRELELSDDECPDDDEHRAHFDVETANPSTDGMECLNCERQIERQTLNQIVDQLLDLADDELVTIYAPIVRNLYGAFKDLLVELDRRGFRTRIDGELRDPVEPIALNPWERHTIDALVDRMVVSHATEKRLKASVAMALELTDGVLLVRISDGDDLLSSSPPACQGCGTETPKSGMRSFLFLSSATPEEERHGNASSTHEKVGRVQPEARDSAAHGPVVWRVTKILLRTVWQSTKIIATILLVFVAVAIFLLGIFLALWRYWEGEAASERGQLTSSSLNESLFSFLETITWLPREIWGGFMLLLTPVILGLVFAGGALTEFASSHSVACVIASCLLGLGISAWVFSKEWAIEFATSPEQLDATATSWVMGLVVIIALIGACSWWGYVRNGATEVTGAFNNHYLTSGPDKPSDPKPRESVNASSLRDGADRVPIESDSINPTTGKQEFSGDFTIESAFTSLFGNYNPSSHSSSVLVAGDAGDKEGEVTAILDSPFAQRGAEKRLVVTSTHVADEECHPCGARIGVYVFANRESHWTAEVADKEAVQFGAFGMPGEAHAVKFGPERYGFSLTVADMHQGIAAKVEQFVAPVGNHYRSVLSLSIEGDNENNCEPSSQDPAIRTSQLLDS